MFNDHNISIHPRRDLQRAAQMRAMISNSNRPGGPYGLDPLTLVTPRPGLGRRNSFSGRSGSYPSPNYGLAPPFTPSAFSPSIHSPSISSANTGYRRARSPEFRSNPASFAKGARALHDALEPALAFNQSFETKFNHETEPLLSYTDPQIIDHLWRAKVEWDGVDKYVQYHPGATRIPTQSPLAITQLACSKHWTLGARRGA